MRRIPGSKGGQLLSAVVIAVLTTVGFGAAPALAHNALDTSVPSDGAVLTEAPVAWVLTFTKDVPLESASAEMVAANGVRSSLPAPRRGDSSRQVVFSLPAGLNGEITARWRLVGTDGHVVSARVRFTVSPPAQAVAPTTTVTTDVGSTDAPVASVEEPAGPVPEPVRLLVRVAGYLALLLIGGLMVIERIAAGTVMGAPHVRTSLLVGAGALTAAPLLQLLIFLDDSRGHGVIGAIPRVLDAFDTSAGSMLLLRSVAGAVLLAGLRRANLAEVKPFGSAPVLAVSLVYLVSLAYVGHSRSMAWPLLGVPVDVVHTAASVAWLGGLAALVVFVVPNLGPSESLEAFRRFGDVARIAVTAIVITGVIQTFRLHGTVVTLLTESHGRWLLLKIVLVAMMLKIGDINRRRMARWSSDDTLVAASRVALVRRASLTEIVNGGLVMLVTSILVTSSFG
jgi:copper transport protein